MKPLVAGLLLICTFPFFTVACTRTNDDQANTYSTEEGMIPIEESNVSDVDSAEEISLEDICGKLMPIVNNMLPIASIVGNLPRVRYDCENESTAVAIYEDSRTYESYKFYIRVANTTSPYINLTDVERSYNFLIKGIEVNSQILATKIDVCKGYTLEHYGPDDSDTLPDLFDFNSFTGCVLGGQHGGSKQRWEAIVVIPGKYIFGIEYDSGDGSPITATSKAAARLVPLVKHFQFNNMN